MEINIELVDVTKHPKFVMFKPQAWRIPSESMNIWYFNSGRDLKIFKRDIETPGQNIYVGDMELLEDGSETS